MRWKKKSDSIATVEDVNECGPVVEDVLEARLKIKNCIDFLGKEGYTQKQIDAFEEQAEKRNLDKIRRTIDLFLCWHIFCPPHVCKLTHLRKAGPNTR